MFEGVKVFSATKSKDREHMGEQITRWLEQNKDIEIVDKVVTQSSDSQFHCLTIVIFYKNTNRSSKLMTEVGGSGLDTMS